jgi:hypothetical protein
MRKIEDKKELMKLCSFIIMGDGGVYKYTGNKNYCFIMNMKEGNRDYVEYCKDILENITNCKITERPDYNKDGYIRQPQLRLTSSNHPFFTNLHDRIYTDKYKGLDPHAFKLFDWECLAILFMSDGCSCYKNGYIDISLNMKRLSYGDQLYLKKELKDKFDLEWNINRQNQFYYLRLRTKDVSKFYDGIRPYILPSFQYKILNVEPSINRGDEIVCTCK